MFPAGKYLLTCDDMTTKLRTKLVLVGYILSLFGFSGGAYAASPGDVVINEVAWAGSADSSADEWIELFNPGAQAVDLTGWKLLDDGVEVLTFAETIPAYGYLLIEDSEEAVSNVAADVLAGLSLANSGDSLALIDDLGNVIDAVNESGDMWPAGSSSNYATMERIAASAMDFADSTGAGALASAGAVIVGTPGAMNSVSALPSDAPKVEMVVTPSNPQSGDQITVSVEAMNLTNIFSYGFQLNYDPTQLEYVDVTVGSFLSENGAEVTSFQSGLKNGAVGELLVAEARTQDGKSTVSGAGQLFVMNFNVLAAAGETVPLNLDASSFMSSLTGDVAVNFLNQQIAITDGTVSAVENLIASEGADRYSIQLDWDDAVADFYRVERLGSDGVYALLDEVTVSDFLDQDGVTNGGNIIPNYNYSYRVKAVVNGEESAAVEILAADTRGIKGDNNRSDLVDGRDLEKLALHFAEDDTDAHFDALVDTTYDSRLDGSDLIDIGASFASAY